MTRLSVDVGKDDDGAERGLHQPQADMHPSQLRPAVPRVHDARIPRTANALASMPST